MAVISPLAYVHPDARLAEDVKVEAFVFIDKDVEIGDHVSRQYNRRNCHRQKHQCV